MLRTCLAVSICTLSLTFSVGSLSAQDSSTSIVFTGCPPFVEGSHCDSMFYQVVAVDLEAGSQRPGIVKYLLVSGPGTVDERTGLWVLNPERDSVPNNFYGNVEIAAYKGNDTTTGDENCRFHVRLFDKPAFVRPMNGARFECLPGDTEIVSITINEQDWCDVPRIDSVQINPEPTGLFEFDTDEWSINFIPDRADSGITFELSFRVVSGSSAVTYVYYFDAFWPEATYSVRIGYQEEVYQGQLHEVPITLEKFDHAKGLGGFDVLVAFDASALAFRRALGGDLYDSCGWEYFTYRYGPYGNCDSACPSGLLRVIGMAETNNGPHHPSQACAVDNPGWVSTVPVTLATLQFLVSNDPNLDCQFVPIRFFWDECGDNTLVNHDGSELYLSSDVFEVGISTSIAGVEAFPTYRGAQQECFVPGSRVNLRAVDFYNGGLDVICADTIDNPGDVNCNAIPFEIADALTLTNYFLVGVQAFGQHSDCSIAASDANEDGITLSVADLVYMTRVIMGDPLCALGNRGPCGRLDIELEASRILLKTDDSLGGAFLVVDGVVTPTLLVNEAEMRYQRSENQTRVLIQGSFSGGPLVSFDGTWQLVSIELSNYCGLPCEDSSITVVEPGDQGTLPAGYSLCQNYPNPFNPATTIQYDLPEQTRVRITVYNTVGQVVRTLVDRHESPGQHETIWDGRDDSGHQVSSGLYLYRMTAGDFMRSRKMLLLK